jgi:hypothetical protein
LKNKNIYILVCVLVVTSLSCNYVTRKLGLQEDTVRADLELGEVYTSYEGGYSFQTIPDYSLEEQWGIANMVAPDGDETNGPLLTLVGGLNNDPKTTQDIYQSFLDGLDESFSVVEERETTLADAEAMDVDLEGAPEGIQVRGRVLISAITPTQQFTLVALAPIDRWDEIAPYFEAVFGSIEFFEPEVDTGTNPEEPQPTEEPASSSGSEETAGEIPADVPFPDSLAAGSFLFTVVGQDEDATIEEGYVQDQSTTSDFVIGLMQAGDLARYFLTIMLKLDTAPGIIEMRPYDQNLAAKGPSAAIFVGAWYYYATHGTYEITDITHDYVSGRFNFEANREDGNGTIAVSGAFNQIPLVWK